MNEMTDVRVAAVTAVNLGLTVLYHCCILVGAVVMLLLVMLVTSLDPILSTVLFCNTLESEIDTDNSVGKNNSLTVDN